MAESTVKSASTSSGIRGDGGHHPTIALVLLTPSGSEGLREALQVVAPACVEAAVELCVVWSGEGAPVLAEWPGLISQCVRVDASATVAERREQAARALGADILLFTDDRAAIDESWQDVLAFRLGLLRRGVTAELPADWASAVDPLGFPGGGTPA
jgi:hypothetical protein